MILPCSGKKLKISNLTVKYMTMPPSQKNYHQRREKSQVLTPAALDDTRSDAREEAGEHDSFANTQREKRVGGYQCVRKGGKGLPDP